jgi:predicted RecB family nuclease
MINNITNSLFADYLSCIYKAYLKVNGKSGKQSEYEILQKNLMNEYRESALHFLTSKWKNKKILKFAPLNKFIKNDYEIGFNIRERFDLFDVTFEGLIKDSKKEIVPVILVRKEKVNVADKLHLAFLGFVLSKNLSKIPSHGRIIYRADFRSLRVKLEKLILRVHSSIESIKSFATSKGKPQMYINSHCQICEFKKGCLEVAKENDELSLLSGLNAQKIAGFNNKGIFTIHQLSYTFKPRKRKKNQHQRNNPFRSELKALAIRDNKVYVFETPELPHGDIEIYLDIEGLPDENFYYLIGVLINDKGCYGKGVRSFELTALREYGNKELWQDH